MAPKRSTKASPTAVRGGRKKKDPNAPKKARSAYLFFTIEKREEVIKKHPELKSNVTEVAKLIGAEWRELDDEKKVPYAKKAEADKVRYSEEMEGYRKTGSSS